MPFDEELFALALDFANSPKLPALKERFKEWSICKDHATAAAFGYLAAMREVEEEKKDSIYDCIADMLADVHEGFLSHENATELAFEKIYHWLNESLVAQGYSGNIIHSIDNLFSPLVKPGVIS